MTDGATLIGHVAAVTGAKVLVHLSTSAKAPLLYLQGESYRLGQVGAFVRIPMGYSQLYAVCTQVGAVPLPEKESIQIPSGQGWMNVALFGESLGASFERGVAQFPTIGDEVHLVTEGDLQVIFGQRTSATYVEVGRIASSSGIRASINLDKLVSRHSAVIGSTGSGKSNFVTVLLESIAQSDFTTARVLVIDPHGEYSRSLGSSAKVLTAMNAAAPTGSAFFLPYWALPFSVLCDLMLGGVQPAVEEDVRRQVLDLRLEARRKLAKKIPKESVTADSPIPFSIKRLWHQLQGFENMTFLDNARTQPTQVTDPGSVRRLRAPKYPAVAPGMAAPYKNTRAHNIQRQLDLMKNRLQDNRFSFLFQPPADYESSYKGKCSKDLGELVGSWVGHDKPITVLDVSAVPSEVLTIIIGALLKVIYEVLFWAGELDCGGRQQPLLIVLEEAHLFLPDKGEGPAQDVVSKIAKEGRKYGVGVMLVSQRPTDLDAGALSQCGSIVALRTTNASDRAKVESSLPDDLGEIGGTLPALRTGEGIVIGEAVPAPSRIRFDLSARKDSVTSPTITRGWRMKHRSPSGVYDDAVANWRAREFLFPGDLNG